MKTDTDTTEENHIHLDNNSIAQTNGCVTLIISLLFWWVIISHCIMRFKNPTMTETQLFLNLPKSFLLEEPKWGMQ